jgi:hypothetical protein
MQKLLRKEESSSFLKKRTKKLLSVFRVWDKRILDHRTGTVRHFTQITRDERDMIAPAVARHDGGRGEDDDATGEGGR